jgi:hypothetical protein
VQASALVHATSGTTPRSVAGWWGYFAPPGRTAGSVVVEFKAPKLACAAAPETGGIKAAVEVEVDLVATQVGAISEEPPTGANATVLFACQANDKQTASESVTVGNYVLSFTNRVYVGDRVKVRLSLATTGVGFAYLRDLTAGHEFATGENTGWMPPTGTTLTGAFVGDRSLFPYLLAAFGTIRFSNVTVGGNAIGTFRHKARFSGPQIATSPLNSTNNGFSTTYTTCPTCD